MRSPLQRFIVAAIAGIVVGTAALAQIDRARSVAAVARADAASFRLTEIRCLAENVYYESRGEPLAGQYAVAEVTMNRVAAANFPDTVCAVVHSGRTDPASGRRVGAFSWTARDTHAEPHGYEWRRAQAVASSIYDTAGAPLVDGALFYHATYVTPDWSRDRIRVARIGRHLFYQ